MGVQIQGDTGNVIATKGTYSGNVTIGGTLTYEDVTNIDSVGLITAREGIEVGASPGVAASISVDGNMIVSGITTIGGDIKVGSGVTIGKDGHLFATGVTTSTTVKVGAAVTISESGIEASGIGITVANINGAQIGGRRNIIINGGFNVAQRGTSATTPGDEFLTTDRIRFDRSGLSENTTQAQVSVTQGTSPYEAGFRKALKLTNGNNSADVSQYQTIWTKIEADDMASSGWHYTSPSSFITFSFWVKSSVAQNFYGYLYAPNRSGGGDIYPFETGSLSANTWTKVIKTVPGHSNVTFSAGTGWGLQVLLSPYFGTNYTDSGVALNTWAAYASGTRTPDYTTTWQTTDDATFETTGWQLEVGQQATPFEFRPFGEELRLCHRYYQKLSGDNLSYFGVGNIDGANQAQILINFVEEMRTAPTSLDTSGTASHYSIRVTTNAAGTSVPSLSNRTTKNALVEFFSTSHGFTSGQACFGRSASADAYLGFNAEI